MDVLGLTMQILFLFYKIYKGKKSCSVPIICKLKIVVPFYLEISSRSIVVANKTDLPNHEVDLKQAEEYAEMHNMIYVEASAKTGQGTNDIFRLLVHEIRNKVSCIHIFISLGGGGGGGGVKGILLL